MATKVSICSNALLIIGDKTINDLADESPRARACANLYDNARDAILRMRPWNSCIKRVVLSPDATSPAFGWAYAFVLPVDFIRCISITKDGSFSDFRIEGSRILCDENAVYLKYVFRNDEPPTYDAGLINCITLSMAKALSYQLSDNASLRQEIDAELKTAIRSAASADGQERVSDSFEQSVLISSRSIG